MQNNPSPFLGVIEGFYGQPWSWEVREEYCSWLSASGYAFFIYAPKADKYLRKSWGETWPDQELNKLRTLSKICSAVGLKFGIGLSPYEIYKDYGGEAQKILRSKVELISKELKPSILCLLFDDMQGDIQDLASLQVRIADDVAAVSTAERHILCPTYYSLDPVLSKLFGEAPSSYLENLGQALDPRFDFFWTGPRICSAEYPVDHLEWITSLMRRKPFLWDNYPVNDDKNMSLFLHLRAYRNRPGSLAQYLSGHSVNPMMQPWLSQIPLATLPMSYAQSESYDPLDAFRIAATKLHGESLAKALQEDLPLFQDTGLGNMTDQQKQHLQNRYHQFLPNRVANEVVGWLQGQFAFDPNCYTE